jgi:glycosyltransferase involved in cell wall biosynthesis
MKILMLTHSLRRGGAERVMLELALGLQSRGHSVEVVSWLAVDEYQEDRYLGIRRHYLLNRVEYKWVKSIPVSSSLFRRVIKDFSPDVIQIHSLNCLWLSALANIRTRCVCVVHGYGHITRLSGIKAWVVKHIYRLALRLQRADIVTVCESMKNSVLLFFNVSDDRIFAVPNGVDISLFPFKEIKKIENINILILGTLSKNKGQRFGVKVFHRLLEVFPEAKLWIVGEGDERDHIENLSIELGLTSSVYLTGVRNDIASLLTNSDLLWHLSESEAMPMVVIEAMSIGLPVIGFDVRGLRDTVVNGETGYLVPFLDLDKILEKSIALLTNDQEYRRFCFEGRRLVENLFSRDAMVDCHERILFLHLKKY